MILGRFLRSAANAAVRGRIGPPLEACPPHLYQAHFRPRGNHHAHGRTRARSPPCARLLGGAAQAQGRRLACLDAVREGQAPRGTVTQRPIATHAPITLRRQRIRQAQEVLSPWPPVCLSGCPVAGLRSPGMCICHRRSLSYGELTSLGCRVFVDAFLPGTGLDITLPSSSWADEYSGPEKGWSRLHVTTWLRAHIRGSFSGLPRMFCTLDKLDHVTNRSVATLPNLPPTAECERALRQGCGGHPALSPKRVRANIKPRRRSDPHLPLRSQCSHHDSKIACCTARFRGEISGTLRARTNTCCGRPETYVRRWRTTHMAAHQNCFS